MLYGVLSRDWIPAFAVMTE